MKRDFFRMIWMLLLYFIFFTGLCFLLFSAGYLLADAGTLPGSDESSKLEAAGTLLRLIDTGLFKWGARLFAGMCIMSGAWALKEQRFGMAVICVIGAVVFGTAPTWVKNVFSISGESSVFGSLNLEELERENESMKGVQEWLGMKA